MRYLLLLSLCSSPLFAIIGGKDVEHSSGNATSPVVALQMSEMQPDGSVRYYKGSAALVNRNTLITAGHNVAYIPSSQDIVAIFSSQPCWGENICNEIRIPVKNIIVHPKFRQIPGGTEFDLAVVRLREPAPKDYIPFPINTRAVQMGARRLPVLGFGTDRDAANIPLSAFRLRQIELTAANSTYYFGGSQKFWMDQEFGGFCSGDSGGPAILSENNSLAGIAVHVTYNASSQNCLTQGAFTDLLYFKDWIQSAVNELDKIK